MLRRVLLLLLAVAVAAVVLDRAVRPAVRVVSEASERVAGSLAERMAAAKRPELLSTGLPDGEWDEVKALGGTWQFRIGDDAAWRDGPLGDGWEPVPVPGAWEDAGFWGYDGPAWYRRSFTLSPGEADRLAAAPAFLYLGRVDDIDEVWVNGVFVGATGRMPAIAHGMRAPVETAYFQPRFYPLPAGVLRPDGPNTVAVRVWDSEMAGGMLDGVPALYVPAAPSYTAPPWVADLAGRWRFRPGDDPAWAEPGFDDAAWDVLTVPARWEPQGYPTLDGFAWYRTRFAVKDPAAGPYVLLLGLVDDLDEVFLDGVRIGGTGDLDHRDVEGDEWERLRAYPIPDALLAAGTEHTLAVRVYDGLLDGGIYAGPVGVLRQADYERLVRGDAW